MPNNDKSTLFKMVAAILIMLIAIKGVYNINQRMSVASVGEKKYIAIVIDDFGNNSDGTDEMLKLDIPITAAVMPNLPSSSIDAENFYKKGCDVIVHLPMEAHVGKKSWLGPKGITCDLSEAEIDDIVTNAFSELKYAIGVNNHMGSKIMEDKKIMNQIIKIVKDYDCLFIDSKTTGKSVAKDIAEELSVTYIPRDVFLDGTQDVQKIEEQLRKTAEIAKQRGYAVAIGHVGVEGGRATATALKNLTQPLMDEGIEFVKISELKNKFF